MCNGLRRNRRGFTLACVLLTLVIYLPLVLWLSIWIGLAAKTRLRAIMTAMAVVVGWCVLPLLLVGPFLAIDPTRDNAAGLLYLLSPLVAPAVNEFGFHEALKAAPWVVVLVNFSAYALILFAIRNHCLANADRFLRR